MTQLEKVLKIEDEEGREISLKELHRARIDHLINTLDFGQSFYVGEVSAFFNLEQGTLEPKFPLGNGDYSDCVLEMPRAKGTYRADLSITRLGNGELIFDFTFRHRQRPEVRTSSALLHEGNLTTEVEQWRTGIGARMAQLEVGNEEIVPFGIFVREDGVLDEDPPVVMTPRSEALWHSTTVSAPPAWSDLHIKRLGPVDFALNIVVFHLFDAATQGIQPVIGLTEFEHRVTGSNFVLAGKHLFTARQYEVLQEIEKKFDECHFPGLTRLDFREIARQMFEQAWRWRKYSTASEMQHPSNKDWEQIDVRSMFSALCITVETLQNWKKLGFECFQNMRKIGESLVHIGSALPEKPGFTGRVLFEGIPLRNGSVLSLPVREVLSGAYLNHCGWRDMRTTLNDFAKRFWAPEFTSPYRVEDQPFQLHHPNEDWLPDSRNHIGHCFFLGLRPDIADKIQQALFEAPPPTPPFRITAPRMEIADQRQKFELVIPD